MISSQLLPASPCYTPSLGHSAAYRWPCSRPGKVSMILLLILQDWYQVPPGPKQESKAVLATPQHTITLLQITSSHTPTPPLVDFSPSGNTAKVMSKLRQEEDHPRTQHSWLLILVSSLLSWVTLGRVHCLYEPHFSCTKEVGFCQWAFCVLVFDRFLEISECLENTASRVPILDLPNLNLLGRDLESGFTANSQASGEPCESIPLEGNQSKPTVSSILCQERAESLFWIMSPNLRVVLLLTSCR